LKAKQPKRNQPLSVDAKKNGADNMAIVEELEALRAKTLAAIEQAADTAALDEVRVRVVGKTVNEVRNIVEEALESRKKALAAAELEASIDAAAVDVTMDRSGLDDGIVLKVIRAELVNCPRSVALFGESRALDSGDLFSAGYTLSGEGSAPLNTVDPEGRSGTVRLYGPENLLEGGKLATYLRLYISYNGGGWYTGAGEYLIYRIRLNGLRRSEILPITVRPVGTGLNPLDPWMIDKGALRPAGNI